MKETLLPPWFDQSHGRKIMCFFPAQNANRPLFTIMFVIYSDDLRKHVMQDVQKAFYLFIQAFLLKYQQYNYQKAEKKQYYQN